MMLTCTEPGCTKKTKQHIRSNNFKRDHEGHSSKRCECEQCGPYEDLSHLSKHQRYRMKKKTEDRSTFLAKDAERKKRFRTEQKNSVQQ